MKDRFIGWSGAVLEVVLIGGLGLYAFYDAVLKPIICGVTAGCGVASW